MRIPKHIGVIPDGNRRWAVENGLEKDQGYLHGIEPGLELFKLCQKLDIKEITYYGFTTDNTKRPSYQKKAFIDACIKSVELIANEDCELLVIGNADSPVFPEELKKYTKRTTMGKRWDPSKSKLYRHIKDKREEEGFNEQLLSNFVNILKNDSDGELDFLKDNDEFNNLLNSSI